MPAVWSIFIHAAFCSCPPVLPIPCLIYYLTVLTPGFPMIWLDFWPQSHLVHLFGLFVSFSLQTFVPDPVCFLYRLTWYSLWNFKFLSIHWTWKCGENKDLCSLVLCFQKWLWKDYLKKGKDRASLLLVCTFSFLLLTGSFNLELLDLATKSLVIGVLQDLRLLFNVKTRIQSAFWSNP